MAKFRSLARLVPFIILLTLLALLCRELLTPHVSAVTSSMIGEPVPAFSLPSLYDNSKKMTQADLGHGHGHGHGHGQVTILNVWATWCSSCREEHAFLMTLKNTYHIPIYGILYKDDAQSAKKYLKEFGNPYVLVGNDAAGDISIDFGVYGTPESYVIDASGKIIYRQVGAMTEAVWASDIYPLIIKK